MRARICPLPSVPKPWMAGIPAGYNFLCRGPAASAGGQSHFFGDCLSRAASTNAALAKRAGIASLPFV